MPCAKFKNPGEVQQENIEYQGMPEYRIEPVGYGTSQDIIIQEIQEHDELHHHRIILYQQQCIHVVMFRWTNKHGNYRYGCALRFLGLSAFLHQLLALLSSFHSDSATLSQFLLRGTA